MKRIFNPWSSGIFFLSSSFVVRISAVRDTVLYPGSMNFVPCCFISSKAHHIAVVRAAITAITPRLSHHINTTVHVDCAVSESETLRVRNVVDATRCFASRGGYRMARGRHYAKLPLSNAARLSFSDLCILLFLFLSLCRLCVCVFLCSHWSLVDVPLIFFCPADHDGLATTCIIGYG